MPNTNNVDQVSVGKPQIGGAVFRAPSGTALPTDAETALAAAYVGMGYISEDGMTRNITRETTEIKDWGGETIATPQTNKSETVRLKFVQSMNPEVLKAVHGSANVEGSLAEGLNIVENANELEEAVWVIEQILNTGRVDRLIIPKGKVTEIGEITYKADEPIGYELTITGLPDTYGNSSYEYISGEGE